MSDKRFLLEDETQEDVFQPAQMFGNNYQQIGDASAQSQHEQQYKPPAQEQTTRIEFENFDLNSAPAFSQSAPSSTGNANSTIKSPQAPVFATSEEHFGFSDQGNYGGAPNNNNDNTNPFLYDTPPAAPQGGAVPPPQGPPKTLRPWHVEYYGFLFDVSTVEVGQRILCALLPLPNFFAKIQPNPDLYGPWWIASTLVFILAATSNAGAWFEALKDSNHDKWHFDVTKISVAASVIYGYLVFGPLLLWGACRFFKIQRTLMEILCIYGYSFFIYLPITILCVLPFKWIRWVLLGFAGLLSTAVIISNFFVAFRGHMGKGSIMLLVMAALHVAFALSCIFYFFAV